MSLTKGNNPYFEYLLDGICVEKLANGSVCFQTSVCSKSPSIFDYGIINYSIHSKEMAESLRSLSVRLFDYSTPQISKKNEPSAAID